MFNNFKLNKVVDLKQNTISNPASIDGLKADCTISIKDEDFIGLASGTANAQQVSINNDKFLIYEYFFKLISLVYQRCL